MTLIYEILFLFVIIITLRLRLRLHHRHHPYHHHHHHHHHLLLLHLLLLLLFLLMFIFIFIFPLSLIFNQRRSQGILSPPPPPQRERGKKDLGSGWSRILVTNLSLSVGSQFIRVLSLLLFVPYETGSLGNHGRLSFDFAANICHIHYIAFNI